MDEILTLDDVFNFSPLDHLDSDENVFFERQLEHILVEMTEVEQGERTHRSFFPIDTSAGATAEQITWRQITRTGSAKILANYADEIPVVNQHTEETSSPIRSVVTSAIWDLQSIRASAATGRSLDREGAFTAREVMLRKEGDLAFNGSTPNGLQGLFSSGTGIPFATVTGGTFATKSAELVLNDLRRIANEIPENTEDVEEPDTLALPVVGYNYIHETDMGLGSNITIAQQFLKNNPYIKRLTKHRELKGKGPGGEDVMVAYKFDKRKIQLNIPLDVEMLPPTRIDMTTKVIWHMRLGGLTIRKPLSLNMKFGI